jgi:hypothetical protein
MRSIAYNDMQFAVEQRDDRWDITYRLADGSSAVAGAGLFAGLPESEAEARALTLIKTIFPVGIKSVGPDVNHPNTIGDLKIIGPDVTHPNFIYWNKDSVSCPKEL